MAISSRNGVVIGYEEFCGFPIFIDTSREGFPVYTARTARGVGMHNQSLFHWTLSIKSLPEVAQVANGREYPTALEKPP